MSTHALPPGRPPGLPRAPELRRPSRELGTQQGTRLPTSIPSRDPGCPGRRAGEAAGSIKLPCLAWIAWLLGPSLRPPCGTTDRPSQAVPDSLFRDLLLSLRLWPVAILRSKLECSPFGEIGTGGPAEGTKYVHQQGVSAVEPNVSSCASPTRPVDCCGEASYSCSPLFQG